MLEVPLIITSLCMVVLLVTQFLTVRRSKESLRREARAISDRAELVDFINRYTASIGYSHNTDDWMRQVAGFIENAMEAEAVWIYKTTSDGVAHLNSFSGKFPMADSNTCRQSRRLLRALGQDRVVPGEESSLINEVLGIRGTLKEDFNERYGEGPVRSLVSVPMVIDGEHLGIICAINRTGNNQSFTIDDMFLLESMSTQVALGLTFVQIYDELGEKHRIEQELKLAQSIQNSLLPEDPPEQKNYLIHADCFAAREVSGDFFDFISLPGNLFMAIVADASGKGMPACMLTSMCRSIIRTNADRYKEDLEGLMREVNQKLFEDTDSAQFITLACLLIDNNDFTVEYARAGHTSLLMRYPDQHVEVISPDGPALGLLPEEIDPQYDTFSFSWLPGMSLMLYTDGITEALNQEGEEFGNDRLIEIWNEQEISPVPASQGILRAVHSFSGGEIQEDDQTLMLLHRPTQVADR